MSKHKMGMLPQHKKYMGDANHNTGWITINEDKFDRQYWRYHFAGLAMQSCAKWLSDDYDQDLIAQRAVEMADALLAELEKSEGE